MYLRATLSLPLHEVDPAGLWALHENKPASPGVTFFKINVWTLSTASNWMFSDSLSSTLPFDLWNRTGMCSFYFPPYTKCFCKTSFCFVLLLLFFKYLKMLKFWGLWHQAVFQGRFDKFLYNFQDEHLQAQKKGYKFLFPYI